MTDREAVELRDYFERVLAEMDRRYEQRYQAQVEALKDARDEINRRLADMNQLREQITTERGSYVPRDLYDTRHEELRLAIASLDRRVASSEGGSKAVGSTIVILVGAASLLTAIIAVVVTKF